MTKNSFTKNLILHIRYPWTAACILVLWLGLAVLCAILHFSINELTTLLSVAGATTLIIALVGFRA